MALEDSFRSRISKECYDLFAVFSRFEYAMKKGGFRQAKSAAASWDKFGDALGEEFLQKVKSLDTTKLLFDAPPCHLERDGNGVKWSEQPSAPTSTKQLFDRVKDVRNNLFHGEKYNNNDRDKNLAIASLAVLNEAYNMCEADQSDRFKNFIVEMEVGL